MKIPDKIVTRNKIRDAKMCILWAREGLTFEEISRRFNISSNRVSQIIYKNHEFVLIDKKMEKLKRVNHLKRLLKKHPENLGSKTTLDILDSMKNEVDGKDEKGSSGETKIIIIRATDKKDNSDDGRIEAATQSVSRHISV